MAGKPHADRKVRPADRDEGRQGGQDIRADARGRRIRLGPRCESLGATRAARISVASPPGSRRGGPRSRSWFRGVVGDNSTRVEFDIAVGSDSAPTGEEESETSNGGGWGTLLPHYQTSRHIGRGSRKETSMTAGSGTQDGSLGAEDAARHFRLPDVARRSGATRRRSSARSARPRSSTTLRAIDDLHAMLKAHGDWMDLGAADEQKDAKPGTSRRGVATPQPGRRLVRAAQGLPRPVRDVHAAADRGPRPGRADPRRQEQPDAGDLRTVRTRSAMNRGPLGRRPPATFTDGIDSPWSTQASPVPSTLITRRSSGATDVGQLADTRSCRQGVQVGDHARSRRRPRCR